MANKALFIGPEPLRRHRVAAVLDGSETLVDASDGIPALVAALGGGLFSSAVHIRNVDALRADDVAEFAKAAARAPGPLVAEADKVHAATVKKLAAVFDVEQLSLGRTASSRKTLQQIAAGLGVDLDQRCADELCNRAEADPGRAVGVIEALAAGSYSKPTFAQVNLLLGTVGSPGLPWTLLDHLENGRAGNAASMLETVDAIPAIAFLSKRFLVATLIAEDPGLGDGEIARLIGTVTPAALTGARRLAQRLGRERLQRLVAALADADTAAKRGNAAAALTLAVGHISLELGEQGAVHNTK